jgi:putative heme iron utilization protein
MTHESRLDAALRTLLATHRVAALGILDEQGLPGVSMVPFALEPTSGAIVLHVSGLAPHTRYLQTGGPVSLMVMHAEAVHEPVHALARVTLAGAATILEANSSAWQAARQAYLARFPEAEPMTQLGDFVFVSVAVTSARHVAGFGAARALTAEEITRVLRPLV